ncbi:hypothetical protein PT282_05530 [Bifidobacterium sp. ESL0763]|uniref:hypothetical protein n=1 Tax=Bifidobacterium sp. ESL0763 TaxID=2983227 RepID=UPI0023F71596|nr:hypothetical protein [Bifidobacterium sp. ESL0763]MDF7664121.1 hypothetical protein [Bifidobacterium sp. ESL0763]
MANRKRWATWRRSALCALGAVCLALATMIVAPLAPSSPDSQLNAIANADQVSSRAGDEGTISYAPKLFKMLANNQRIDTAADEMRVDFVLRVAHNQVNTSANKGVDHLNGQANAASKGGLRLRFGYGASSTGSRKVVRYIPTIASSNMAGTVGALNWANNQEEFFTIHNLIASGQYDYLLISVECDIDYPNSVDTSALGGEKMNQYLWAQIPNASGNWPSDSDERNDVESGYQTNVLAGNPAYVYDNVCGSGNNQDGLRCNGPKSFIGWNDTPLLWSGNQANWGLVTDYGLNGLGVGWAPARSFFVMWYNRAPASDPCSKNTSFYYQWLGLKGGKDWVPVDDLTPHAERVDGQNALNGHDGLWFAGSSTANAAFNARNILNPNAASLVPRQGPGGSVSPAVNIDGSYDLEKAKTDQGLDGYFKLVTWPITTSNDGSMSQCLATTAPNAKSVTPHDAFNPLEGGHEQGITDGMDQAQVDYLVDKGWTIDTAFDKYSLPEPPAPTIDTPAQDSVAVQHPVITGTGLPGHKVTLYAEDVTNPIDDNGNVDDAATRGRYVGHAIVGEDGTWSVTDADNPITDGTQRYHAWQTEQTSGYDLTSPFSNIRTLRFSPSTIDSAAITVPHTKRTSDGELPAGSKVHISGTAAPSMAGQKLTLYATHTVSAGGARTGETREVTDCTQTLATSGQQDWSCRIDPAFFLDEAAQGDTYVFNAVLANPQDDSTSRSDDVFVTLDMTSTQLAVDPKPAKGKVSGTAHRLKTGSGADVGAKVSVTWPDDTTASMTVGADGRWSFDIPEGMDEGEARITADDHPSDAAQNNESGWVRYNLATAKTVKVLPVTGDRTRLLGIVLALVATLLAMGMGLVGSVEYFSRHGKAVDDS